MKKIFRFLCIFTVSAIAMSTCAFAAYTASPEDIEDCSKWAREELVKAAELEFIPEDLAYDWQEGITRLEFTEAALYFLAAQYRVDPEALWYIPRIYDPEPIEPYDPASVIVRNDAPGNAVDEAVKEAVPAPAEEAQPFDDTDSVYAKAAADLNVISGRGERVFDPYALITREEAAKILLNVYNAYANESCIPKETDLSSRFSDGNKVAQWARPAVSEILKWKVMQGISDDRFDPKGTYTREQCFATFLRLWNNGPCSRPRKNVQNLKTYKEALENIKNEYGFEELYSAENDKYHVILYSKYYSDTGFVILYKDGGWKDLSDDLPNLIDYPDSVPGGFKFDETKGVITFKHIWNEPFYSGSNVYTIDLETAKVDVSETVID